MRIFSIRSNKNKDKLKKDYLEITKLMSGEKLKELERLSKDGCVHCSSSIELNEVCSKTVPMVRKLWEEKGFESSLQKAKYEKVVLLFTEVAELADAAKKGKGEEEEVMEIADIVIRACNILGCDEFIDTYNNLDKIISRYDITISLPINGGLFMTDLNLKDSDFIIQNKYKLIEKMIAVNHEVMLATDRALFAYNEADNLLGSEFIILWNHIIHLIAMCKAYLDAFVTDENLKNLHNVVTAKMNINFQRPYKYNTFEETK